MPHGGIDASVRPTLPPRLKAARRLFGWTVAPMTYYMLLGLPYPPQGPELVGFAILSASILACVVLPIGIGRAWRITKPLSAVLAFFALQRPLGFAPVLLGGGHAAPAVVLVSSIVVLVSVSHIAGAAYCLFPEPASSAPMAAETGGAVVGPRDAATGGTE